MDLTFMCVFWKVIPIIWSEIQMHTFVADVVISYLIALLLYLLIEGPIHNLIILASNGCSQPSTILQWVNVLFSRFSYYNLVAQFLIHFVAFTHQQDFILFSVAFFVAYQGQKGSLQMWMMQVGRANNNTCTSVVVMTALLTQMKCTHHQRIWHATSRENQIFGYFNAKCGKNLS